jgi:hypothetical protein
MVVRPHYPSAAAKQAAYRARKQAALALAAQECAVIQQALRTRALADQSWELYELIVICHKGWPLCHERFAVGPSRDHKRLLEALYRP